MTNLEYLLGRANECAMRSLKTEDVNLKAFYVNASLGFSDKALSLTVGEAREQCPVVNAGEREALLRGLEVCK